MTGVATIELEVLTHVDVLGANELDGVEHVPALAHLRADGAVALTQQVVGRQQAVRVGVGAVRHALTSGGRDCLARLARARVLHVVACKVSNVKRSYIIVSLV